MAAQYILLDEAQDINAVVLGVLNGQDAQIVYVGDRHQQIYEWRGAVNAMEKIAGCEEAALTQSFRFGETIAASASRVLATLGETQRIRGNPTITSNIAHAGDADAVLARTNATVILEVLEAVAAGRRPCVVGGTKELQRLLSDVYELKAGKPAVSPEFFGFTSWAEVVAFADTEEGESLRTFVQLVEHYGERKLWAAIKSAQDDEEGADVILSTAHKAKGREWNMVRLAADFASARLGPGPDAAAEVRLFYVAMTRAKRSLIVDPEVLATFATDAWKTKQPQAAPAGTSARPASPSSMTRPVAPPQSLPSGTVRKSASPLTRVRNHGPLSPSTGAEPYGSSRSAVGIDLPRPIPESPSADMDNAVSSAVENHNRPARPVPETSVRRNREAPVRNLSELPDESHRAAQPEAKPRRTGLWNSIARLFGA